MEPKLILLLVLVAGTQGGPIIETINRDDPCARRCTNENKFRYQPGTTYEFQYDAETKTSMQDASEDHAGLKLSVKAQVEVLSKCEMTLQVRDVSLTQTNPDNPSQTVEADSAGELRRMIEANPLRFSFQDGSVEELCPVTGEDVRALNIKRGILSTFQNSMQNFERDQRVKETDVSGECDADYRVSGKKWYSFTVKKSKNLLGCNDGHDYHSSIQSTPYRVPSDIQSLPLVKSTHECEQEITNEGRLQSATCEQAHVFRPFSREQSGAVTTSKQTLNFVGEKSGVSRSTPINDRVSMLYQTSEGSASAENSQKTLEKKMMELCENTRTDVRPDTPALFAGVVYMMRSMDSGAMKQVYTKITSGALCSFNQDRVKKFFLDAIPMVGTVHSVRMMADLISSNDVTGMEADMWFTSLAFVSKPTSEMIEVAKPLLSLPGDNGRAMLSVSALVNNYCGRVSSCITDREVISVISILEQKIGSGCTVTSSNKNKIVLALRAIGNAGNAQRASATINRCFTNAENPTEVRLAAIDAYRRISCDADRRPLMDLFRSQDEDSELRIGAYLAVMECPSESVLNMVKLTLASEEVNQVGSFVWSHLTNLMETSDPLKQDIRAILEDETLQREFNMDQRKYSRNYEGSFFLDKLNTGAKVESNLIWSPKSFIPRSGMLNLTVDLFGHSVNFFEIGGRIEGLEYFLESYFGPNGYFGENNVRDATKQSIRTVRPEQLNRINQMYGKTMDQLKGAMFVRVFGNELRYKDFDGVDSFFGDGDFNILELLLQLSKNHDYSYTQSYMFMDSSMIIPTSIGFPMNLTVNGTATVDLKASGKMDLRKVASSPTSLSINGIIQPSGAVEISTMMSVDAFVTKSGLKMVSTLHSSTSLQGRVELSGGRILNAELNVPQEKMEIFDVKTSFFVVHGDSEREQQMITDNKQMHKMCTGDRLSHITGMELCAEMQFPNASLQTNSPYFPFTGPISAGIALLKRDSHTSYKLECKMITSSEETRLRMAFDTPGSRVDRELALDFDLNKAEKSLGATITSPWKKASLKGSYTNQAALKTVTGSFILDDQREWAMTMELARDESGEITRYTPRMEIRRPDTDRIALTGTVKYQPVEMVDVSLTLSGVTQSPVVAKSTIVFGESAKGSVSYEAGEDYSFEVRLLHDKADRTWRYQPFLSVRTPDAELVALGGSVEYTPNKAVVLDITLDKVFKKSMTLTVNTMKSLSKKRSRYNAKFDLKSQFLTSKLLGTLDWKNSRVVTSMKLDYNSPQISKNSVSFNGKWMDASAKNLRKHKINANMDVKRNPELNFLVDVDMNFNDRHSEAILDLHYGDNLKDDTKRVYLLSTLNHDLDWVAASADYNMKLIVPQQDVDWQLKGDHKHDRRALQTNMVLKYGDKQSVQSSLRFKDKSSKRTDKSADFSLSYPTRDIQISNSFVQTSANKYVNTLSTQLEAGQKGVITTTYRHPGSDEYLVTSDIQLPGWEMVTVNGQLDLNPRNFKALTQLTKAGDQYSATVSGKYTENIARLTGDLLYPSRHMTIELQGKQKANSQYSTLVSAMWDADRDQSRRMEFNSQLNVPGNAKMNGELNFQIPTRSISASFKHAGGKSYVSHGELQWGPSEKVAIDSTFRRNEQTRQIDARFLMTTPFESLSMLDVDLSRQTDRLHYNSSIDVSWGPTKKISTVVSIKKPFSFSHIEGSIIGKTPIVGFERYLIFVNHDLNHELASSAEMTWNKKTVRVNVNAAHNSTENLNREMSATVGITTPYSGMESLALSAAYKDDGHKLENSITLDNNGRTFSYNGEGTYYRYGWQLQSNGEVTLRSPYKRMTTTWSHRNTLNDIRSSITNDWGLNARSSLSIEGQQKLAMPSGTASFTLGLQSPIDSVRDILFTMNHEHRIGFISSSTDFKQNSRSLGALSLNYARSNGQVTSQMTVSSPITNELGVKLNTQYNDYPVSGHMEIQWAPTQKVVMDGSYSTSDMYDDITGNLRMTSPFQNFETVVLTMKHNKDGLEYVSTGSAEYGTNHRISLENRLRTDSMKSVLFTLDTTYPAMRHLQAETAFRGDLNSFHAKANLEAHPLFSKTAVTSNWSTYNGVIGNIRLDMPLTDYRYMQMSIDSRKEGSSRKSNLNIEYRPNKVIKIESSLNTASIQSMDGSVKITSPCPVMPYVAAAFENRGGLNNFQSHAEVEMSVGKKIELDVDFMNSDRKQGSVLLKVPEMEDMQSAFSMEGDLSNLRAHAEASYGKENQVSSDVIVRMSPSINIEVTLSTPIQGFENIRAVATHTGDWSRFQSHGELTYSRYNKYAADVIFSLNPTITAEVNVATPITGYANNRITFSHEGSFHSFHSNMAVSIGPIDDVTGDVRFSNDPKITAEATFKTPISGWENIRGALSHEGDLTRFVCHAEFVYGQEKIEGDMNFDTTSKIYGEAAIKTPWSGYEDMRATLSHSGTVQGFNSQAEVIVDQQTVGAVRAMVSTRRGISCEISITTPIPEYETSKASFSVQGTLLNFKSSLETLFHGETIDADMTFKTARNIEGRFVLKTPYFRTVKASMSQTGSLADFDGNVDITYGRANVLSGTCKYSLSPAISGSLDVDTSLTEPLQVTFSQSGEWKDSRGDLQVTYGTKSMELEATLNAIKDFAASVTVTSPFEGLEDLKAILNHGGSLIDFHTHVELIRGVDKIACDMQFSRDDSIDGRFTLKTSFENLRDLVISLQHRGGLTNFHSHVEYELNGYRSEGDVEFARQETSTSGRASLTLPDIHDIVASFSHRGMLQNFQTQAELNFAGSKQFSLDTSANLETSQNVNLVLKTPVISTEARITAEPNLEGSVSIQTPFTGFEDIRGSFSLENQADGIQTRGEVTYAPGKRIEADITLKLIGKTEISATMKTPFTGMEQISVAFMHNGVLYNFNSHVEVMYGVNRWEADVSYDKAATTTSTATLKTPYSGYENMAFSYRRQGTVTSFQVDTDLTYGSKTFALTSTHRATDSHIESSVRITTPYTEDMSMRVEYTDMASGFKTTSDYAMGNMYKVVVVTSLINNYDSIKFNTDVTATYDGYTKSAAAEFKHKKSWSDIATSAFASYGQDRVEGKFEFSHQGANRFDTTVEVKTPFDGYRQTKATYSHTGNDNGIDCNFQVVYGESKEVTGTIHATVMPVHIEVNIKTPYEDFDSINLRSNFENTASRYSMDGEFSYKTGKTITVTSVIDLTTTPKTLSFELRTPYQGFESTELNMRVSGLMNSFRTSTDFRSSFAPSVSMSAELRYRAISDLDGSLTITTGIPNLENIKFAVQSGIESGKYVTHTEASWNTRNRITVDSSYIYKSNWYGANMAAGLRVRTPFQIIRDGSFDFEHNLKSDRYVEKLSMDYNGRNIMDGDLEYNQASQKSAVLNIRRPWPMRYSASGLMQENRLQGDISINWNTDDMNSNVRMETTYNNNDIKKDFTSKIITSSRTVSAQGSFESTPRATASNVDFFWDEAAAKGIGYDMAWNDNSRRSSKQQDGRFKLRTPLRSFQVTGAVSDNGRGKAVESAFFWDADKDQTKKITMESTFVPQGQAVKADVTLAMPSIGKDVKLDSEMTFGSGRLIFDGKTEFSYSPDTRKTLVVNSRLEDISSAYNSKNYSFSLGLRHPYTSVDVQLDSHLGSSDEKYSAGVSMVYLTAHRNRQNLALRGEIDRLRHQMNIEMLSPVKSMKMVGSVQTRSPYRASLRNLYDGRNPVNVDITVDPANKNIALDLGYDASNPNKVMHVYAGYVNDSALRVELYREMNSMKTTDSLLALRLNTSHILHTRLHWRPSMINDIKEFGLRKINDYGVRTSRTVGDIGRAVEEELNLKYNLIRQAAVEDFEPYAAFIKQEVNAIISQLDSASRELQLMILQNQFFLSDVSDVLNRAIQSLRTGYSEISASLEQWYSEVQASGEWSTFPLMAKYEELLEQLKLNVEYMEQDLGSMYESVMDAASEKLVNYRISAGDSYTRYSQLASDAAEAFINHPRTQNLHSRYQNLTKQISEKVTYHKSNMADFYNTVLGNAKQAINSGIYRISQHGAVQHASSLAQTAYQQGAVAYKYWELEENAKAIISAIWNYIKAEIDAEIYGLRDSVLNLEKSAVSVYDIENGEIQVDFYLPVALENLQSIPSLRISRYFRKLQSLLPGYSYQLSDYIPDSDYTNWVPPFSATGSYSNGAITTWDGKKYMTNGRCSYILASDFNNQNFTIVKSEDKRNSLSILNNGKSIEIRKTGKVFVNGKNTELPYAFANTTITRSGDTIRIEDARTFAAVYNIPSASYTFSLSGWYYGKTGGLLGTYDNEPGNDLMMSNNHVTEDVPTFLRSWEVGSCSR